MPRGDKGKRFEKGNKFGRGKKVDPVVKELRELDRSDLEKVVRESLQLTELQIKKRLADKECQAKERLTLRIILRGIGKGDHSVMQFLSDYLFGSAPKKILFSGNMNARSASVTQDQVDAAMKKLEEEF